MQPVSEIEQHYANPDPWGVKTSDENARRKRHIIHMLNFFGPHYSRALDIACGEAWITQDVPASTRHGYEISDNAAARFPPSRS